MSKIAIQALQTIGEEQLINQASLLEFQKGVSKAALMRKYGIGQDRLYKAIHGKICPGRTQYQMLKKEQTPTKEKVTPHKSNKYSLHPHLYQRKEKAEESHPRRSKNIQSTTPPKPQNPGPFQDYQKLPK